MGNSCQQVLYPQGSNTQVFTVLLVASRNGKQDKPTTLTPIAYFSFTERFNKLALY